MSPCAFASLAPGAIRGPSRRGSRPHCGSSTCPATGSGRNSPTSRCLTRRGGRDCSPRSTRCSFSGSWRWMVLGPRISLGHARRSRSATWPRLSPHRSAPGERSASALARCWKAGPCPGPSICPHARPRRGPASSGACSACWRTGTPRRSPGWSARSGSRRMITGRSSSWPSSTTKPGTPRKPLTTTTRRSSSVLRRPGRGSTAPNSIRCAATGIRRSMT